MPCARPVAETSSRRPVRSTRRHPIRILCSLWKVWTGRLAHHLVARRHARDLADMTDRMRADIGLPARPPEIRARQMWPPALNPHKDNGPRPFG